MFFLIISVSTLSFCYLPEPFDPAVFEEAKNNQQIYHSVFWGYRHVMRMTDNQIQIGLQSQSFKTVNESMDNIGYRVFNNLPLSDTTKSILRNL